MGSLLSMSAFLQTTSDIVATLDQLPLNTIRERPLQSTGIYKHTNVLSTAKVADISEWSLRPWPIWLECILYLDQFTQGPTIKVELKITSQL